MINANEAEKTLTSLLLDSAFDFDNPNPKLAWDIYKKFFDTKVHCADDALLFQCGVHNFTGEDLFHFGFVRQFIFEAEGEYKSMEQLALTFYFEPNSELQDLKTTVWTYDYKSADEFFNNVEGMQSFIIPIDKYEPLRCEVSQAKV